MVFKRMFRGGTREDPAESETIEDLIVLERYGEAEQRLKTRLRENPDDLHSYLKLAEVHTALRRVGEAVEDYLHVADEYARDGFYDKGIALLSRAHKLIPTDDALPLKIAAIEQIKALEHKRAAAVEGVRQSGAAGTVISSRVMALQRGWPAIATGRLIGDLATDQVRRLFAAFDFLRPEAGDVPAREGEPRPILFLLVGAQVEATAGGTQVRRFGPRDILGESALFERAAWPVTLTVIEPGLVLALDRAGVERALVGNPDPRGLLGALRARGIDRELEGLVRRMRGRA